MVDNLLYVLILFLSVGFFIYLLLRDKKLRADNLYFIEIIERINYKIEKGYDVSQAVYDILKKERKSDVYLILDEIISLKNKGIDLFEIEKGLVLKYRKHKDIIGIVINIFRADYPDVDMIREIAHNLKKMYYLKESKIEKTSFNSYLMIVVSTIFVPIMVVIICKSFMVDLSAFVMLIIIVQTYIAAMFYGFIKEEILFVPNLMIICSIVVFFIFKLIGV
jgi:hypothetical protein